PESPFTVIIGGAKVSDKIGVMESLLGRADRLLIGGAMAYTFLAAQGGKVGNSLVEPDKFDVARSLLDEAERRGVEVHLPIDSLCAAEIDSGAQTSVHPSKAIPDGLMGLDAGPKAIEIFREA